MSETDKVVPLKTGKCPLCAKPAALDYRPFCSKRCALLDLGQWLGEGYKIAGEDGDGIDGGDGPEGDAS